MSRPKKTDLLTRLAATPDASDINEAVSELRRLRREVTMLKSSHRLYRIQKSDSADCALAKECYSSLVSGDSKAKWMEERDLFVADGRAFAAVDTETHIYFMDVITGSLYNFGECLTSVHGRTGFIRDRAKAMEIIRAFNKKPINGDTGGINDLD